MANYVWFAMSSTSQEKNDLPADEPLGVLEPVALFNGAMPTGVAVSHQGRIFVNFPKWGDEVPFTVSEIRDGGEMVVAYPDEATIKLIQMIQQRLLYQYNQ